MLKPRRANIWQTRTSAPGLFSTRTERVWVTRRPAPSPRTRRARARPRRRRADRRREPVAHRPEPARRDERPRTLAMEVLHRPHLVLADAGRPDHVVATARQRLEGLHQALRLDQAVLAPVAERELFAP